MNDKDLLKLAAKAYGEPVHDGWNPIENAKECTLLMDKLGIEVSHENGTIEARTSIHFSRPCAQNNDDWTVDARKLIVQVAAAIGGLKK